MSGTPGHTLSVSALFAERDARRRRDREGEEQLQRRREEERRLNKEEPKVFSLADSKAAYISQLLRGGYGPDWHKNLEAVGILRDGLLDPNMEPGVRILLKKHNL